MRTPEDHLEPLREKITELRAALKPFADLADHELVRTTDENSGDVLALVRGRKFKMVWPADFKRAARVYESTEA